VARADHRGRPPLPFDGFPAGRWLLEKADELEVRDTAPKPLVQGRHLIDLGLEPGAHFGPILEACYAAQIEGEFTNVEDGITFARAQIARAQIARANEPGRR
jgi:tRNA nucleotidyltransferase (CCA-adding enzyme)